MQVIETIKDKVKSFSSRELLYLAKRMPISILLEIFKEIPIETKLKIVEELSENKLRKLLEKLSDKEIFEILRNTKPRYSLKIIRLLPESRKRKILTNLPRHIRETIKILEEVDEEKIINYVRRDVIVVSKDATIEDVIKIIKSYPKDYYKDYVFIVGKTGKLLGYVKVSKLLDSKKEDPIIKYKETPKEILDALEDRENVIFVFNTCNCDFIPVYFNKKFYGIITIDEALKILEEERSEDLFKLLNVQGEEKIDDPISKGIRNRTPWLIINLFTAFLDSIVINPFQNVIKSFVLFAVFLPVVAGEAGNATTQTMAIMVRSLAIKDVRASIFDALRALKREIPLAIINSLIVGFIASLFAYIWKGYMIIAIALALAMLIDMFIAAFMGVIIPLILEKLGIDPASSSTIILTTFTDVFGFIAFLGIGGLLLKIMGTI